MRIDFLVGSSDEVIDPCLAFAQRCFPQTYLSLFLGLRTLLLRLLPPKLLLPQLWEFGRNRRLMVSMKCLGREPNISLWRCQTPQLTRVNDTWSPYGNLYQLVADVTTKVRMWNSLLRKLLSHTRNNSLRLFAFCSLCKTTCFNLLPLYRLKVTRPSCIYLILYLIFFKIQIEDKAYSLPDVLW